MNKWPRKMIIVTNDEREHIVKVWGKKQYLIPFVTLLDGNYGIEESSYTHKEFKDAKGIIERGEFGMREVRVVEKLDCLMYADE